MFNTKLADKLYLRRVEKSITLSNLSIYYTWKNIKSPYNNNKFKIAPTWNDKFEIPDGSYFVSDIQDYNKLFINKANKPNKPFGNLLLILFIISKKSYLFKNI